MNEPHAALQHTAQQECALLGHQEVDVEHVLLAAMHDSSVARMLARHGVTLEGTRQQVDEVAGEVPHEATGELHHEGTADFPVSQRARRILAGARSTPQVVLAALDLPDRRVATLLERQGADVEWVHAAVARLAAGPPAGEKHAARRTPEESADVAQLQGHDLIAGIPGQSRRRSRLFQQPWEQLWPHIATAEGARAWLLPDERTRVSGPGEFSGEIHIGGSQSKGTCTWRLLDTAPPSAHAPGHVLWQEDWQLSGRGRSGPGRWMHLAVFPVEGGTHVDLVTGRVRHGRFRRLLRPVISFSQALTGRHALHHLGLAVAAAGPAATRRQE